MSAAAIKRIVTKDIKSIQQQNLNELGIYVEFNEENMLEAYAMIIGPEDSVYKNIIPPLQLLSDEDKLKLFAQLKKINFQKAA